ncbi:hypothetical protein EKO04_007040 [Ascochyta lentis]|uniref:Uncharacterized protein n=1 Tax=Ascochyta lentis TaxID=205686 RepID=A0A8H7J1K8_9PLEO|nr:hypothetical protein EKO04_007040 [Ascochyta lentis]
MALTWAHLLTVLNAGALFFSLALIGVSPATGYFTGHGMRLVNEAYPRGYYEWYRGPSYDMDTRHFVKVVYESTNEYMIFTAAAVGGVAGVIGVVGFFLTLKQSKPTTRKSTLYLLVLPGFVTFIVTLITFTFSQVIHNTDNKGQCYWEHGYIPNNVFVCTRELAACNIAGYFRKDDDKLAMLYDTLQRTCGATQTGRHLVAPLFVASVLMFAFSVAKLVVEKRQSVFIETADERVDRLTRQEE